MTDEQIIERCKAAGIKWIPPQEDEDDSGAFPGSFDMVSMAEMRALLSASIADTAGANSEAEQYKRMFLAACSDLGLINEALGLDPNDGGADPILSAIAELKAERDQWVDAQYADAGMCKSCVDDKCVTGSECVTLGLDTAGAKPVPTLKPRLLNQLRRFNECCEDPQADGHDVDREDMHSLAEFGAVRPAPGGRHYMTDFGAYVLAIAATPASSVADAAGAISDDHAHTLYKLARMVGSDDWLTEFRKSLAAPPSPSSDTRRSEAPTLPRGLIRDLLTASDLLSKEWRARNAEVGKRLYEYAEDLSNGSEIEGEDRCKGQREMTANERWAHHPLIPLRAYSNAAPPAPSVADASVRTLVHQIAALEPLKHTDNMENAVRILSRALKEQSK